MPGKAQRVHSAAPWESEVGYCRAIRRGDHLWVTGTAPVAPDGSVFAPGDPYRQTGRGLEILSQALAALGASTSDVVRTRMFCTDIGQWREIGRAHGEVFRDQPPATTLVEVRSLIDPAMLIEIEAEAFLG